MRASGCATCRLPARLREEVHQRHRAGSPLRAISAWLADQGHPVHRDALHRHLRNHLDEQPDLDLSSDPDGLLVAVAVADVLRWQPSTAAKIAERLVRDGAHAAAKIVLSGDPLALPAALEATANTPAGQVLEARSAYAALLAVCRDHPSVAVKVAAELRSRDLADLAQVFLDLTQAAASAPALEEPS